MFSVMPPLRELLGVIAAVLALHGCYLTHERGETPPPPRDSGVDSPPPPDAPPLPDTGVPPPPPECEGEPWARIDLGMFPGTRIGPVAASRTTIAWVGQNLAGTTITRLDRRTLDYSQSPIDPEYMQDAAVFWTGEVFVVAYEHTGPRGTNQGVYVTVAEDGIGGFVERPTQLSPTGGDPRIAGFSPDRVLIAWNDRDVVATEYSPEIREPLRMNLPLGLGAGPGVAVVATPEGYLVGRGASIRRLDLGAVVLTPFASTSGTVRRMVVNDLAISVEQVGGTIETFAFDGAPIAIAPPVRTYDIAIAGHREWFFGINPQTGETKITDAEFVLDFTPGEFVADLASVSHTPTGFVALTASLPVGNDPLVTLIERCDAP